MLLASLTAAALLVTLPALAQPDFMMSIPNGFAHACSTCHDTPVPAAEWNAFGTDIKDTLVDGKPDWASVCEIDSDGDGATNGEELGDSGCTWVMGDENPVADVFHPGDEDSVPEPDDIVDPWSDEESEEESEPWPDEESEEESEPWPEEAPAPEDSESDDDGEGALPASADTESQPAPIDEPGAASASSSQSDDATDASSASSRTPASESRAANTGIAVGAGSDDARGRSTGGGAGGAAPAWSVDDGGCQGGHSPPLSLAAMGLCLAILMRRRVA